LIGALLSMGGTSQRAMLDAFFGSLDACCDWRRVVSDRAFAKARERLDVQCLSLLNAFVAERAEAAGLLARWHGLRVVAADASVLMPAVRPCHTRRFAARPDQRLFSLYLPAAQFTLHACVYGPEVPERQMLFEALDTLGPDDVLVLDRGYPAAWLLACLQERGIRFCIRADKANGFKAVREFVRSGQPEATVTMNRPTRREVRDYGCADQPITMRLVRQVTPDGLVRVLLTNLPAHAFPCEVFADLYHQRWGVEEGFKRLKHRAKLESVSGLTQQAVLVDVAAKVLADNLASLICLAASEQADLQQRSRVCNRAYAASMLRTALPRMVLGVGCLLTLLQSAIDLLAATTHRRVQRQSCPRPKHHRKPHPSMAYKG
jgi:hypothetical protein